MGIMKFRKKLSPEKQILVQKAIDKMMPREQNPFDVSSTTAASIGAFMDGTDTSLMDYLQEIKEALQHQDFMINEIYEEVKKRHGKL